MTKVPESKAMSEIREIREALSREMKKLPPEQWASFIRKKAAAFEKKHKLDLPEVKPDAEKTASGK